MYSRPVVSKKTCKYEIPWLKCFYFHQAPPHHVFSQIPDVPHPPVCSETGWGLGARSSGAVVCTSFPLSRPVNRRLENMQHPCSPAPYVCASFPAAPHLQGRPGSASGLRAVCSSCLWNRKLKDAERGRWNGILSLFLSHLIRGCLVLNRKEAWGKLVTHRLASSDAATWVFCHDLVRRTEKLRN